MSDEHADRPPGRATEAEVETFRKALKLLEGKWTLAILWQLTSGRSRFGELRRVLPGITQRMLSRRLQELEAAGMIIRSVYPDSPPRVEYAVSQPTMDLGNVFNAVLMWADKHSDLIARQSSGD